MIVKKNCILEITTESNYTWLNDDFHEKLKEWLLHKAKQNGPGLHHDYFPINEDIFQDMEVFYKVKLTSNQ